MSGKRRADNQVTRENLHEFENEENDEAPSGPSRATADVLAKRKILKPRSRLHRAAGANGNSAAPAPSSGFSFGSNTTNSDENKPANPFGGIGGFGTSTSSAKPAFSFDQSKPAEDSDKPKTNPFQFLGKPQESTTTTKEDSEKPKSNVFSFLNNNNSSSNTSLTKTSSTDLVSSKQTEKPNKIKALNDNFYDKITEQRQLDPVSNFTPILRKYIDYYDKIENDLDYLPDADNDTQEKRKEQKALPAPTFSFGKTDKPAITNSTTPSFSFGVKPAEKKEEVREEKEPTPMEESKDNTQNNDTQDVEEIDSDDSDDSIKVEGPKFTLAKPPTTTDSVFKLDATSSSGPSSSTGPSFTFKADTSKKFNSPFKLPTSEKKEEPKESPAVAEVKSQSSNNFSWSPDKPIKFNGNDDKEKEESAPKPAFSFGETTKPAFSFGQSTEKKDETSSKPAFSFGTSTSQDKPALSFGANNGSDNKEAAKPAFSFGTPTTDSTKEASKPTISFGSSATNSKPAFSFGTPATTTESSDKSAAAPSFNFGGASSNSGFGFGTNSAAPSSTFNFSFKSSSETKTDSSNGNDDEKVPEEEVEGNFKPVVQLTEKVEDQTGEENEETLYTKRSKLMLFNPSNKEQPYESKGLGELKVLQNKDNKKSRILVRSDGANRVLLNAAIPKDFKYDTIGKGDSVRIPVVSSEGKIETYIARVKTPEDGSNLLKALQDAQKQ